ncbi:hypothetical protein DMENIID0001_168390 [Sergentomyia squamirostris]
MKLLNIHIVSLVTLILTTTVYASVAPATVVDVVRSAPPNVFPWVQETNILQRFPVIQTPPVVFVAPAPPPLIPPPTIIRYPSIYHPSYLPPHFNYYGGPIYPSFVRGSPPPSPFYPPVHYPFLR